MSALQTQIKKEILFSVLTFPTTPSTKPYTFPANSRNKRSDPRISRHGRDVGGVHGTNMRVLGGVTNHTFYKYFLSREHLLYKLSDRERQNKDRDVGQRKTVRAGLRSVIFLRSNNFFCSPDSLIVMVTSLKLEMTSGEWMVHSLRVIPLLVLRAFLN